MKKLLNRMRLKLVEKLIRPDDGYTYTGFSEREPLKFYYQEDTGKYLLGKRSDNWYYFELQLCGWHSYASRYLPWGKTVEKCVFNCVTKEMDDHTYNQEPKEIDFRDWIYGLALNVNEQYRETIMAMGVEEFVEIQRRMKEWEEWKNEHHM